MNETERFERIERLERLERLLEAADRLADVVEAAPEYIGEDETSDLRRAVGEVRRLDHTEQTRLLLAGGEKPRPKPAEVPREGRRKTVAIDFDGVIHAYTSGWQGGTTIADGPVEGAIAWLRTMVDDGRFAVAIYSSRNGLEGGIGAMKAWLSKWYEELFGRPGDELVEKLDFPEVKPPAHLTLDDRAVRFSGKFPEPDVVANFKPWYK
jgi:hypothetical protein